MKPSGDFSLYQKIWDFTREQLSVKYPFFRKLLWNFSFKESEDTETAGTDGRNIYFNPDFVIKSFQESSTKLEELFLHMLYHCLFLHLIMDVPPDRRLWDLACDAAVQRILQNEKRERDPMKIYQEFQNAAVSDSSSQPDSSEPSAEAEPITPLDDHNFWKYTDRQKFLETIRQTLGGMSGAAGMGLYGNSGRGSAPGNQVEELSVEEKGKYDFHHFLRRFAVHREEIHTDAQSFDYIPYIFGLDHYGNIPLIEYLEYQEVTRLEELVIAIDTSGSCSADTVRRFMEETYGILSDQENFFRKMNPISSNVTALYRMWHILPAKKTGRIISRTSVSTGAAGPISGPFLNTWKSSAKNGSSKISRDFSISQTAMGSIRKKPPTTKPLLFFIKKNPCTKKFLHGL